MPAGYRAFVLSASRIRRSLRNSSFASSTRSGVMLQRAARWWVRQLASRSTPLSTGGAVRTRSSCSPASCGTPCDTST